MLMKGLAAYASFFSVAAANDFIIKKCRDLK
jgi:hypothetical protein